MVEYEPKAEGDKFDFQGEGKKIELKSFSVNRLTCDDTAIGVSKIHASKLKFGIEDHHNVFILVKGLYYWKLMSCPLLPLQDIGRLDCTSVHPHNVVHNGLDVYQIVYPTEPSLFTVGVSSEQFCCHLMVVCSDKSNSITKFQLCLYFPLILFLCSATSSILQNSDS